MTDAHEFAVALALEAGDLLKDFYNPAGIQASAKPDQSVITEADVAADSLITKKINQYFPLDSIVSEESSHCVGNARAATWVIDPLDGTTNFSLGLPVWGVSIARLDNGYPELGILYFPLLNELYTVRRGKGAFLNRTSIYVREPNPAQSMSFFACCSRSFRTYNVAVPYKPRILGSSAYSFCMVARGAALLGLDVTPKIWDLAAAWLLVEEAGGIIKPFEAGQVFPISTELDYSRESWPILAAATQKLFNLGQKKITRKETPT